MIFGPVDEPMPEVAISEQRLAQMLVDIKRNSRNRRIALFAPVILAAAVVGAMIAAPAQHGGLALVADAEAPDPELPRVFGSNGVWRLAEPIEEGVDASAGDRGPASIIEAPIAQAPAEPDAPSFTLSPPDQEDLSSLPASTSTPPTSTSGQSSGIPDEAIDPTQLDWSSFGAVIRIEPSQDVTSASSPEAQSPEDSQPLTQDASVESEDSAQANPSTPASDLTTAEVVPFSTPATIIPQSVLVYNSAHVSVRVQVVDDDSSVIDWCNTRVDWGDGSITRVAGADDAALCTASCEYEAASSASSIAAASISESVLFEHEYTETIDASPRIFVATGDGCSYTLAELQLAPFTVVPLP